jgi:type IV pilus assembly protein PilM
LFFIRQVHPPYAVAGRCGGFIRQTCGGLTFFYEGLTHLNWKLSLNLGQNEVVGLDIGSSTVKLIQLRKDDAGYAVTAAGIADIAPGRDDINLRRINIVRAIRECLRVTGVETRLAVCGVSGPEVAVRDFRFPSLPAEEVEGALLLEAAQVCPFNTEDSAVDWQLIPDGGGGVVGILVAATNSLIRRKVQLAKEASLDCVLMDVDGIALLNCFSELEKAEPGQTIAILNIGSSYTTLAIMGENRWPFIRDISYTGNDIVEQIAAENNMPADDVKEILFADSMEAHTKLHDSLANACKRLIVDVTETSRYYKTQEKTATFEKLFVCGGFAMVKGFTELLSSQLPVKALLWNPLEKIRCDVGRSHRAVLQRNILAKNGPAMVVACGLAMRSI